MNEEFDFKVKALKKRIKELEKENSQLKFFKFSLENIPSIMLSIINREYCYEVVNKKYADAFNTDIDKIIGKPVIKILGDKLFHTFAKANYDKSLNGEYVNHSGWIYFPNSKKKFLDIHYVPLYNGDDIIAVAVLVHDITTIKQIEELLLESQVRQQYRTIIQTSIDDFRLDNSCHKRTEQQLKESCKLLLMIVDGISEPLVLLDKRMNIILMNTAARAYSKHKNENYLGKKCYQVLKNKHRPCKGCKVPLAVSNGQKKTFERKSPIDPRRLEKISIYPVRREGKLWAAIIRLTDITKTEQIENELIQADKMISLGVLVSGIAHEINNPNNLIMLNIPIVWKAWESIVPVIETYYKKNGDFNIAGIPYCEIRDEIPLLFSGISEGTERIRNIVQELKNFVRNDNTNIDQFIDINDIIKKSIRLTKNLIKEKTNHFKVDYSSTLPPIKGDPQKIEQVFINLIENACQALPNKEKEIFISSFFEKTTGHVVVKIQDEGRGIHPKVLNRIMDPFFTTKKSKGGTGLGLAVCSRIVELHGGKIETSSAVDKGSTFKILLPVQCGEDPA